MPDDRETHFARGDGEADACRCPACTSDRISTGTHNPARGPVQCESVFADPLDQRAMREIEGNTDANAASGTRDAGEVSA